MLITCISNIRRRSCFARHAAVQNHIPRLYQNREVEIIEEITQSLIDLLSLITELSIQLGRKIVGRRQQVSGSFVISTQKDNFTWEHSFETQYYKVNLRRVGTSIPIISQKYQAYILVFLGFLDELTCFQDSDETIQISMNVASDYGFAFRRDVN